MKKWISVKDRIPQEGKFVLVCTKGCVPRVALFHNDDPYYYFLSPDCMRVQFKDITHWQPLPEPPGES